MWIAPGLSGFASGAAGGAAADENGHLTIGQHHVEGAVFRGIQRRHRVGRGRGRGMHQGEQRKRPAAALARRRAKAAGAVQHRGDDAIPVQPIQVPPPARSRPAITPGCSGQWAAGGSQARSRRSSRLAASSSGQA